MGKWKNIRVREEFYGVIEELYEKFGGKEVFGTKDRFFFAVFDYVRDKVNKEELLIHYFEKTNPEIYRILKRVLSSGEIETTQEDEQKSEREIHEENKGRSSSNDASVLIEKLL